MLTVEVVLHTEEDLVRKRARDLRSSSLEAKLRVSAASRVHHSMAEQDTDHPTQGRRRRRTSPSNASVAPLLPVPRLADHLDANDGPSDEGEKEAKRQKSEPTTPISTSSRPPNKYGEVMGVAQVDPREAERFEEGVEPEFQNVEEELPKDTGVNADLGTHGSEASDGGFGSLHYKSAWIDLIRPELMPPAPGHSGAEMKISSNPPQVMSPNVGEEQVHDTMSARKREKKKM